MLYHHSLMFSDLTKIYEKRGYVGGGGVKALLKIPLQKSFWEELTFLIDILLNHGSKCLISDELSPKYLRANHTTYEHFSIVQTPVDPILCKTYIAGSISLKIINIIDINWARRSFKPI